MDILKDGSLVLSSIRKKFLSQDIQYRVLATGDIHTLTAAIGKQLFRTETDMGLTIREWASDFIVEAEDLPGVVPERGDEIIYDGRVFEVLAPNGEPVWRWTDGYRTAMRIHTKEAGLVDA